MTSLSRRTIIGGGLGLFGSTVLVACSPTIPDTGSVGTAEALDPRARQLLAVHGIQASTAEDAVTALDQVSQRRPLALTGSVGYDQVAFADDSDQVTVPLASGQFYFDNDSHVSPTGQLREDGRKALSRKGHA